MGGFPDNTKRARVRKYLMRKGAQKESDRAIARALGYSKVLIASVRRQLAADGVIPWPEPDKHLGNRSAFKPGASARGGYVFDDRGRVVQKAVWIEQQEQKARKTRSSSGRATKRSGRQATG